MNRAEAKRRARWAAAQILEQALISGWEVSNLTDDESDAQANMILDGVREIQAEILRPLPIDWRLPASQAVPNAS